MRLTEVGRGRRLTKVTPIVIKTHGDRSAWVMHKMRKMRQMHKMHKVNVLREQRPRAQGVRMRVRVPPRRLARARTDLKVAVVQSSADFDSAAGLRRGGTVVL